MAGDVAMRAKFMAAAALALVGPGMLLAGCDRNDTAEHSASRAAGPRLTLRESETADWQDVSAEIATVDQAQVFARIPGILATLSVREGDTVRKGQVIGRVVDNQLGQQAAAYRAQMVQADAEFKRVKFLHDNGVYADARLDQARAAAQASRAQYGAMTAAIGQGAVIAPASGRVLRADVPAGAPVAPGTLIAVITAGATVLRIEMPELLAASVHVGSPVRASGTGTDEGAGRVIKVYPSVNAGQVAADVEMPGLDNRLIGRRLAARVQSGTRKALLVPAGYVIRRYGIDYVAVLGPDGSASDVPVQTAPSAMPGQIELLSGVSVGDVLVGPAGSTPQAGTPRP